MIKIYQQNWNDCHRAVHASLFGLDIEKVPNYIDLTREQENIEIYNFLKSIGYCWTSVLYNPNFYSFGKEPHLWKPFDSLDEYSGVNGYFSSSVLSTLTISHPEASEGAFWTHSVIIDKDFNIVHDPKFKEKQAYPRVKEIGYNGIINIDIITKT